MQEARIDNASFNNVKLSNACFFDVAMDGVKIINANLCNLEIEDAQLGGAYIHNIGMPAIGHPKYNPAAKMKPLKFEDCMLDGSIINDCSLAGVQITNCNLTGMTINGILVEELLKKYNT